MNSIEWLERWYWERCDNEWEHKDGVTIRSMDNPGWLVRISLAGTPLEGTTMLEVGQLPDVNHFGTEGRQDWMHCSVEGEYFVGAGGPFTLLPICDVFRNWVEEKIGQNK